MKEININEIVKVESIGVIKQQLDEVEKIIDEKVKDIPKQLEKVKKMSFVEQEDEKNGIKKYQQYLSNIQKQLEEKRKEIKKEIIKPYDEFDEYYKNGVYLKLDNGINQLKEVVNEIEDLQKDEKRCELEEFANQYIETYSLGNILSFEDIPLNITLSASMKSLKEQAKSFIERIASDLKLIELEEYKSEILLEYNKNGYDFTKAKLDVITRHKQLEEIEKQQEVQEEIQKQEEEVIEKVEEITIPKEVEDEEDIEEEFLTCTFTVKATKTQLKKLKAFLESEGITYGN